MMNRTAVAIAVISLFALTACGTDTAASAPVKDSATSQPDEPGDRAYDNAIALAAGLTEAGFTCDATPTEENLKATHAKCTLPTTGGGGSDVRLSVWTTPAYAEQGIDATLNHARVTAEITGGRSYYVSGSNWLMSLEKDGVVAAQIVANFGGELRRVPD